MPAMKSFFPLFVLLVLAACSPSEPTGQASSAAASGETPAPAASAAPASHAAAPQTAASAPAARLGGRLSAQDQAKWQSYACEEDQKIDVRYYQSDAGATAQIRHKGLNVSAPYSPELSDEDLSAFSNGELTWTITNFVQTDFYQETDGFLVRHEKVEGVGEEGIVDHLLVQGCMPEGIVK